MFSYFFSHLNRLHEILSYSFKEIEKERYTVEDAILCNPSNCKSVQHPISP